MSVYLRLYTPEDYPMVCEWWKSWGWDCVPEHALPPVGVIAYDRTKDICCAWLYRTDSSVALLEWFISNRKATEHRRQAMSMVVDGISNIAKQNGFTSLVTFTKDPHLVRLMEEMGFSGRADHVSNLARSL